MKVIYLFANVEKFTSEVGTKTPPPPTYFFSGFKGTMIEQTWSWFLQVQLDSTSSLPTSVQTMGIIVYSVLTKVLEECNAITRKMANENLALQTDFQQTAASIYEKTFKSKGNKCQDVDVGS